MSEGKEIGPFAITTKGGHRGPSEKNPNVRNVIVISQGILVHSQIAVTNPAILMRKQGGGGDGADIYRRCSEENHTATMSNVCSK